MNKSIIRLISLITLVGIYSGSIEAKKRPTRALSPEQELKIAKEELTRELSNIKGLEEQRKHINQKIQELHKHHKQNGALFEKFYLDELYQDKLDELTQLVLEERWIKSQVTGALSCAKTIDNQIEILNKKIEENRRCHYDQKNNRWLNAQRPGRTYQLLDAAYREKIEELSKSLKQLIHTN